MTLVSGWATRCESKHSMSVPGKRRNRLVGRARHYWQRLFESRTDSV